MNEKNIFIYSGVLSCIWYKVIEIYTRYFAGWSDNIFAFMSYIIVGVLTAAFSGILFSILIYKSIETVKGNRNILIGLVPIIYIIIKDLTNVLRGLSTISTWIFNSIPEAFLIGFPLGIAAYTLVTYMEGKR